jgi:uncharacterized protein YfdQ (DUF2303 family)
MNPNNPTVISENIAESLAREMKGPKRLIEPGETVAMHAVFALPPGWSVHDLDSEKLLPAPRRKKATPRLSETDSFIDYVVRHRDTDFTTVWCEADYPKGKLKFTAILNDNAGRATDLAGTAQWRDHSATFVPEFSEEWRNWTEHNGANRAMSQVEFALFIESNLKDIASAEGFPTGTQMLAMATNLEITQDSKFKSQARLQNGGVRLEFTEDSDDATTKAMEVFKEFALGLQVFRNGEAYQINARLRYRLISGKLVFWYELIRADLTLEDASKGLIQKLREATATPFFFGTP